ncbi:MAG TPA: hypothetical protein VF018_09480 [Acidobacteriaceae bacterium]
MEPNRFGRKLGIGVRVASRMAKERAAKAASANGTSAASAAQPATARTPAGPRSTPPPRLPKNYAEPARRVGEGTRRFGQAFFGPLKHVSGTLWLEITGLFFALFALFFGQNAWKTRLSALRGPEHAHFLVYSLVTLVFLYFCISSFVKAARRGRKAAR